MTWLSCFSGGCGTVHLGYDTKACMQIACKIVSISRDKGEDDIRKSEDYQQTMKEIKILRKVSHTSINRIIDVAENECPRKICLILEVASGGDLLSYLMRRDRVDIEEARYYTLQIAYGIKYLHDTGIVHRDIKPENLLLLNSPPRARIQISDFGAARLFGPNEEFQPETSSTWLGTLSYISPEMAQAVLAGMETTTREEPEPNVAMAGDMWAIGCVSYMLFTNKEPFAPFDKAYVEYDLKRNKNARMLHVLKVRIERKPNMGEQLWASMPEAREMVQGLLNELPSRWGAVKMLASSCLQEGRAEMEALYCRSPVHIGS
ncbi:kinase-like protein [Calocera viscosa TUFC12733]|uniref:Kinase-like protein n=1 Tax=Calocera viscosa (strain TUFC12733) TaxID=1330018 RepID=A0A167FR92_CALVF|nr:kinase-like protein [Calocera viscosa TUFC12733]